MVRHYKRSQGARNYCNYTPDTLNAALESIVTGHLSQREAAQLYQIPRSTLKNKLRGRHPSTVGGQISLKLEEEKAFVDHLLVLSEYGFPFSAFDLRCLVKFYLDSQKIKSKHFRNNFPGSDWARLFLKRHKNLSARTASNIKRNRAKVSPEAIHKYFDCLTVALQDIPSSNIWNYDETNLVDDPGQKKVLVKRGCKYPERIMNSSKSATSVMFCGNGAGDLLPPYVVYKAENMWDSWTKGGCTNARYNRSKSGWFNHSSFEDWFFFLALPRLKRQDRKKALIGDNLSSHMSLRVIQACKKHDIKFIALPANSTHLTQPLDVAFFRPMKAAWRSVLEDWKIKCGDKPVAKDVFPRLLKGMLDKIGMQNNKSLQAGFLKCGICPVERQKVLDRIPKNCTGATCPEENANPSSTAPPSALSSFSPVSDTVLQYLSESRYGPNTPKVAGKKKVAVIPGRSISESEVQQQMQGKKKSSSLKRASRNVESDKENAAPPKKQKVVEIESDSDPDEPEEEESDVEEISSDKEDEFDCDLNYDVGSYVIVEYEMEYFPGCVVNVDVDGSAEVKVMVMRGLDWGWPEKIDQVWYEKENIIEKINEPTLKPSHSGKAHRLLYSVPEIIKHRSR